MDKQSTLAFILIGLLLVVWLYINAPETPESPVQTADSTLTETPAPNKIPEKQTAKEETRQDTARAETFAAEDEGSEERIITVETDLVRLEITSQGAKIRRYFLKKYKTWYSNEFPDTSDFFHHQVQLINTSRGGGELSLAFVTREGNIVETSNLNFDTEAKNWHYVVPEGDSLSLTFTRSFGEGKEIRKTYTFFSGKYASSLQYSFVNMQDVISGRSYDLMWEDGLNFLEKNAVDEGNYANASAFAGGEQVVVNADDVDEKEIKDINGKIEWIAVRNKYFTSIIAPEKPDFDGGAYFEGQKVISPRYGDREYYSMRLKVPFFEQANQTDNYQLYIGPIDYNLLASYNNNYEEVYDFGSLFGLTILIRPISEYILLPLFKFLHMFIPNYGFVIIVFSIIIKLVLWPLTKQSYKSMRKMQLLQPKMKEIKEKYPDDPKRVQQETMGLYSKYGVSPTGGCLPMVLQMPILFALFGLFNVAIELRNQPFIWWIDNLAAPDVIYNLGFSLPLFGVSHVSGLALLLGVTMFFQQKMSVKDPSQKALVYVMPVMFTVIFMGFPAGLNLYYLMFNVFSLIQQQLVNRSKGDVDLVPIDPKKRKKGFMAKMMEAAEQQQKMQTSGSKQPQNSKKKRKF